MADAADYAEEATSIFTAEALARAKEGPFSRYRPTGFCHWCSEPTLPNHTHCTPAENGCAEDHMKYLKRHQGN